MPNASLVLNNLRSRQIRRNVTGTPGIRTIGRAEQTSSGLWGAVKNFVGLLFTQAVSFGGWLLGLVGSAISLSFTDAWGKIVETTSFLYNFNWQATDEQLDQQLQGLRVALASQYGGAVGRSLGYLVCGIVPSAGILMFNQLLGAYLLKQVGEEALDDLSAELVQLIKSTARVRAQSEIINRFKHTRKAIKKWNGQLPANSWERKILDSIFGNNSDKLIETWGDQGRKPWSFRLWVDDSIEKIQNPALQNFVEEAYEEFLESCVESGFLIAQGLDTWILQQRMTAQQAVGTQRVVEVQPDRSIPEERIILAGGENHIRSQLPLMMANYGMVENRDVGQWIGHPVAEAVKQSPNELTLRIQLYSTKEPPVRNAKQRASITLPDVKKTALDFQKIKLACGGNNGYMYGRFRGKARLDNGKTIDVYANSRQEAEQRLIDLGELVEPDIIGITVTEEVKTGQRANGRPLEKEPIRMYPFSIYVQNKQKIFNQSTDPQGFHTLKGSYRTKDKRIQIWRSQKPSDFDQVIAELLQTEGVG